MTTYLTDDDRRVVVNALYTAAEKYRDCANDVGKGTPPGPGRDSIVAQFQRQSDECDALREKLED